MRTQLITISLVVCIISVLSCKKEEENVPQEPSINLSNLDCSQFSPSLSKPRIPIARGFRWHHTGLTGPSLEYSLTDSVILNGVTLFYMDENKMFDQLTNTYMGIDSLGNIIHRLGFSLDTETLIPNQLNPGDSWTLTKFPGVPLNDSMVVGDTNASTVIDGCTFNNLTEINAYNTDSANISQVYLLQRGVGVIKRLDVYWNSIDSVYTSSTYNINSINF